MEQIWIAMCLPADQSRLPALPPGVQMPTASIDDTLRPCERCQQDCCVGPKKLALAEAGKAIIMCYLCAIEAMAAVLSPGEFAAIVNLDPGRAERPRTR